MTSISQWFELVWLLVCYDDVRFSAEKNVASTITVTLTKMEAVIFFYCSALCEWFIQSSFFIDKCLLLVHIDGMYTSVPRIPIIILHSRNYSFFFICFGICIMGACFK